MYSPAAAPRRSVNDWSWPDTARCCRDQAAHVGGASESCGDLLGGAGAAAKLRETGGLHHQAVEPAGAVHDANHIDAVGQEPAEDQVLANRKVAEVLGDVRAGGT